MSAPTSHSSQSPTGQSTWIDAFFLAWLIVAVEFYPPAAELPAVWRAGWHEIPWAVAIAALSMLPLIGGTIRYVAAVIRRRDGPPPAWGIPYGILAIFFLLLMPLQMQGLRPPPSRGFAPIPGSLGAIAVDVDRDEARNATRRCALFAGLSAVVFLGLSFYKPAVN